MVGPPSVPNSLGKSGWLLNDCSEYFQNYSQFVHPHQPFTGSSPFSISLTLTEKLKIYWYDGRTSPVDGNAGRNADLIALAFAKICTFQMCYNNLADTVFDISKWCLHCQPRNANIQKAEYVYRCWNAWLTMITHCLSIILPVLPASPFQLLKL